MPGSALTHCKADPGASADVLHLVSSRVEGVKDNTSGFGLALGGEPTRRLEDENDESDGDDGKADLECKSYGGRARSGSGRRKLGKAGGLRRHHCAAV